MFAILALTIPTSLGVRLLNADGDVARHLRHGLTMLERGELIRQDPFSYTRAGEPFLAFEYGSQVLYALAHLAGGLAAVAVLASAVIAAAYALVARFLIRRGLAPIAAAGVAFAAAILGANQWIARPHVFTVLCSVLLVDLLDRRDRLFWPLVVLFTVWANLHGGWVFGWVVGAAWLGGAAARRLHLRHRPDDATLRRVAAGAAGAVLGTFLTPHGWRLHQHVLGFLADGYIMANTAEFQRPSGFFGGLLVLALGVSAAVTAARIRSIPVPHLAVMLVTAAFAVLAERNAILFSVTGLPLAAAAVVAGRPQARGPSVATVPYITTTLLLLTVLALARGRVGDRQLVPVGFDPARFPVTAVAEARAARLGGRIFHEFTWGGYLLYAWPEQRVFIDGGTDFYGAELMKESSAIKALTPGWVERLGHWDITLVLMRPAAPLAEALRDHPSWRVWYEDSTAVLMTRVDEPALTAGSGPVRLEDRSAERLQRAAGDR